MSIIVHTFYIHNETDNMLNSDMWMVNDREIAAFSAQRVLFEPASDCFCCCCFTMPFRIGIWFNITKTCPCNVYPLELHLLYSKTGVYWGIPTFLNFAPKQRLWVLVRTSSLF